MALKFFTADDVTGKITPAVVEDRLTGTIQVPPGAMVPGTGASHSVSGGGLIVFPGTAGSNPSALGNLWFPPNWSTYNATAYWTPSTVAAGTVTWRWDTTPIVPGVAIAGSSVAGTPVSVAAPGVALQVVSTQIATGKTIPSSRLTGFQLYRIDSDTYPDAAYIFMILVSKAS